MDDNMGARIAQQEEAARLEVDMARAALKAKDQPLASKHFYQALERLSSHLGHPKCDGLFVYSSLELSNLGFILGQGFSELSAFLQSAFTAAERLGDRRSQSLIKLHLGRYYYFAERRSEAMKFFSEGKREVEELGDDDILTQSSEFLGQYFHMQGLFREAQKYFERAMESFESEERDGLINPSAAMWLDYCTAYLGQFHRAIGSLDYHRRLALEHSDQTLATTLRSVLGLVLLMIKKNREGALHLSGALQEATKNKNALALHFARGGMAYYHLLEGRPKEARDELALTMAEGAGSGLVRQYASPFVLEMIFEFDRLGLEPIPEFSFQREVHRLMNEPNIHLRGVALRLRAMKAAARGDDNDVVQSDLASSEYYLKRSEDPVQLAKTRLEIARLRLREGDHEAARVLSQKAWEGFSGYGDVFYPDDLRHLLAVKGDILPDRESREELLDMFVDMTRELVPSADLDKLLTQTVVATNRFFGAERGGVFWFRRRRPQKGPELRAGCNLFEADVAAEEFRSNLALVFKAYRENKPQVVRPEVAASVPGQVKSLLCVPFEVQGRPQGVLYHDNSYVEGCFKHFDKLQLVKIAQFLTSYIENILAFSQRLKQKGSINPRQLGQTIVPEIVTQCPLMNKVLSQADRVAASESTILILGETGVGKELLARRLYKMSLRREGHFVVVDSTTLTENLVESELFGHEKGAFTGAHRQKKGLIELAHRGTLFIDEVSEIPKPIQAKFLRVLQEKTLVRVGGTQTVHSDFRLLAATNRDLAEEVAAGRFREDLYYRINVVPITTPPLRERIDDVPLLAHHFLALYASKCSRSTPKLMPHDETRLMEYSWPGNVRELQNVIERAVLLSTGEQLELNLPTEAKSTSSYPFADNPTLDELQRRYIRYALEKTGGKISGPDGAAELLGMKRTSLYNRMRKLGLR